MLTHPAISTRSRRQSSATPSHPTLDARQQAPQRISLPVRTRSHAMTPPSPRLWGAPASRMAATSLGRAREVLRIFSGMRSADFFRKFFAGFFRRFLRRNFERGNLLCRMPVRADRSRPEPAIRWLPRWTFGIKHATLEAPRQFTPGSASDDRCPYGRQNTETPSCSASTLK